MSIAGTTDYRLILIYPVGDEDIRFALSFAVAIRGEDDLLSVGAEHREAVKGVVIRDAFKAAAINVHRIKIKVTASGIVLIR